MASFHTFFSFPFFSLFISYLRRAHSLKVLGFFRPFLVGFSLFGHSTSALFLVLHLLSPSYALSQRSWVSPLPRASPEGFPYLGIRPRLLSFYFCVRYRMAMFEPITVRSNVRIFFLLLSLIVLQLFLFHALTSTFDVDESPSIVSEVSISEYPTRYFQKIERELIPRAMDRDGYRACKEAGRACK